MWDSCLEMIANELVKYVRFSQRLKFTERMQFLISSKISITVNVIKG